MKNKIIHIFLFILILMSFTSFVAFANDGDFPEPLISKQTTTEETKGRLNNYAMILGSTWDDSADAVSYSPKTDLYIHVYKADQPDSSTNTIVGAFVNPNSFEFTDLFFMTIDSHHMDNPEVAYDPINEQFLVVWEEYECIDLGYTQHCATVINGRFINTSYQVGEAQFITDTFTVASQISTITTSTDLQQPSVAFNEENGQFLVSYLAKLTNETVFHDLYGRFIAVNDSSYQTLGNAAGFNIREYSVYEYQNQEISWSDANADTFFIVTETKRDDETRYVAGYYLHDTYQDGGDQLIQDFRLAPYDRGSYPLTNDSMQPSVTYDSVNDFYFLAFVHAEYVAPDQKIEDQKLFYGETIYGQLISATTDGTTFQYDTEYAFPIETTLDASYSLHNAPHVSFNTYASGIEIVYRTMDENLTDPDYYYIHSRHYFHPVGLGHVLFNRLLIRSSEANEILYAPYVSCYDLNCLVTWQEPYEVEGITTSEIWGQLLEDWNKVWFDEYHDNQLSLSPTRAQEIEANTPWNDDWEWFYLGTIPDNLSGEYSFNSHSDPLIYDELKYYDAVVIPHYNEPISPSEIYALEKFVKGGGGLILLGDCGFIPPEDPSLASHFGLDFFGSCLFSDPPNLDGDVPSNFYDIRSDSSFIYTSNWGTAIWMDSTNPDVYLYSLTDPNAWLDVNDDGAYNVNDDITGIFGTIGAYDAGCGRLLVINDNTFADAPIENWPGNQDTFAAALDWVTNGSICDINENIYLPLLVR